MINLRKQSVIIVCGVSAFILTAVFLVIAGSCADKSDSLTAFMSQDCTQCHGAETKYPVAGAQAGYVLSGHATLGNSFYSNGAGCQRCHTHEGFVQYVAKGAVDPKAFIDTPSQPGCFTCHDPHRTGDFSLRVTAAVTLDNGEKLDAGKGNLCASCHLVRGDAAQLVTETAAAKVSPNFGPHHGPQADMIAGTNAFEYEGKSYANSAHSTVVKDTCITCHMTLPEGRYGLSPAIGSHSFNIAGEVHEQEKLNTAGCLACHKDMAQAKEAVVFNKSAAADYDNDGKVEPLQLEVEGLLQLLVSASGNGLLQRLSPPLFKPDGSWNAVKEGTRSVKEMAALYNYKFVKEDRSLGVHNAKYAVQILYDTIESLKPGFDTSKRPN